MRRKHQLVPAPLDRLESRVVLSHAAPGPPVGGGLHPDSQLRPLNRQDLSITAEINQDFDLFRNDYDQARATYFTSIQNQPAPSEATMYAFVAYTTQRVSLLAQQTLSISAQAKRGHAGGGGLKRIVATKLMGPRAQMPPGSLARSLLQTIPQPGTTAPTESLYALSQDSAIESARVAILNGVGNH